MPAPPSPTEVPVLPERDEDVLSSLALHRVLSFAQVRRLHFPGLDEKVARRSLARLAARGLVRGFAAPGLGHRRLWSATASGYRVAGLPAPGSHALGGSKLSHTLAVNGFCVALAEQARARGDRFGPLHWANEVAHRLPRGGRLIPDAVLSYELASGGQAFRFLELDRGTMPLARVQVKLLRYGLYLGSGAWRRDYPVFPKLALVLQGAGQQERLARLAGLAAAVRAGARGLEVLLATGDELAREGPLAPIWTWVGKEGRRGFLL